MFEADTQLEFGPTTVISEMLSELTECRMVQHDPTSSVTRDKRMCSYGLECLFCITATMTFVRCYSEEFISCDRLSVPMC